MKDAEEILFLHGGPGLDCEGERRWFGASLPVAWWDQPRHVEGQGRWTDATITAAARKVADMCAKSGRATPLVAHSYGCLIAQQVADMAPDNVGELVLLGPGVSLATQYQRVGLHMMARDPDAGGGALRAAVAAGAETPGPQRIFEIAGAVASLPDWRRTYFSPASQRAYERYVALLPEGTPIDLATFIAGVVEHFAQPPVAAPARFSGPVRILMGRDDVLLDRESVLPYWSCVYPQARCDEVSAGHMIHLELPPESWAPL